VRMLVVLWLEGLCVLSLAKFFISVFISFFESDVYE